MGLLWGPTDARVCERYYRSTVGNESSEGLSLFASKPHAPTQDLSRLLRRQNNHPSQKPAKVQSTCKLPPLRTLLGGMLCNNKPPRKIQIQPHSLMAREASRSRSALRLWGLWDSESPWLALFCSLVTIASTSAPTMSRCNSIAIEAGTLGCLHSRM